MNVCFCRLPVFVNYVDKHRKNPGQKEKVRLSGKERDPHSDEPAILAH
jgi:hypothetical protein